MALAGTANGKGNQHNKGKGKGNGTSKGKGKGKDNAWKSYKAFSKNGIQTLVTNPAKAYFTHQQAALDAEIEQIAQADVARVLGNLQLWAATIRRQGTKGCLQSRRQLERW